MWSAVQYRRIRKDVDRDWRKEATLRQTGTSHDRTAHVHDPESGSTPGSYGVLNSSRNNNTCIDDKDDTSSDESNKNGRIIDPRNWPLLHRAETIAILFLLVFVQGWAGAADSMANSKASEQYHVGTTSENLATAMFLFGIGTGCFFAGPLSESFGRNPVILIPTFVYLFFVLGTALSDTFGGHIVCRYLSACRPAERSVSMAPLSMICSGLWKERCGFRWSHGSTSFVSICREQSTEVRRTYSR
jgi:DHA1 family multidrug resistance protein-like MFS transporter